MNPEYLMNPRSWTEFSVFLEWNLDIELILDHPRLNIISQSWSSYQLNQLGSKAASDSTLKQFIRHLRGIKYLYFLNPGLYFLDIE